MSQGLNDRSGLEIEIGVHQMLLKSRGQVHI